MMLFCCCLDEAQFSLLHKNSVMLFCQRMIPHTRRYACGWVFCLFVLVLLFFVVAVFYSVHVGVVMTHL